jgi:putative transcriptional regulator
MIELMIEDLYETDSNDWDSLREQHKQLDIITPEGRHSDAENIEIAWLLDKDDVKESWTGDYHFETDASLQASFAKRPVDTKAIRRKLKLSQSAFAKVFQLNVRTLQDWEIGRRKPPEASMNYLRLIEKDPELVQRLIASENVA